MLADKKVSEDTKAEIRALLPKVRCQHWYGSRCTSLSPVCCQDDSQFRSFLLSSEVFYSANDLWANRAHDCSPYVTWSLLLFTVDSMLSVSYSPSIYFLYILCSVSNITLYKGVLNKVLVWFVCISSVHCKFLCLLTWCLYLHCDRICFCFHIFVRSWSLCIHMCTSLDET